ncbi:Ankyrin repeats (3 copies) [Legionella nautarum]|uniref:Ankyrin repeats (3 copies) n=1 Tax=Legionella nautarum TaxID=45070 RepID=A0A0W0WS96_9GAMM|nr:ankyrin repeat domain-containing protein [Legionella nautarum]KTD35180.1 Ankyrin repeats (3 copies) [Legionella nautarum]
MKEMSEKGGKDNEGIPELSNEIWLYILSFLDPYSLIKNLKTLELVNSQFRALVNDNLFWKNLFITFFPKDFPSPLPGDFNWQKAFLPLYIEQYGYLEPETQQLIFLIATGNIDGLRRVNICIEDLKADNLVLIKTAIRLNQRTILEYFYSLSQQKIQAKTEQEPSLAEPETEKELELLSWAISPQEQTDVFKTTLLAAEAGHWDLLIELLNSPDNPATQNVTKFHQLYSSIIRSGQMYMLRGIEDFIAHHKRQASTNSHSAEIVKSLSILPNNLVMAASFGVISIFIRLSNQNTIPVSASGKGLEKLKARKKQAMENAMISAARNGHIPIIKYALKKQFIDINQKLHGQSTLLAKAALSYQPRLVQFLLANQADPELVLHELLRQNSMPELEREQKEQKEEIILALIAAVEKREKQCDIELLREVIAHDRVDILGRLFNQKSFIQTDSLIRTLLQSSFDNCAKFLEEKLEKIQSAAHNSNNSNSAEEQGESDSNEADNRHRFFSSADEADTQSSSANQHAATTTLLHG